MTLASPPLLVSVRRRGIALAAGILVTIAAAGLWLEHPWQHPARSAQPSSCRLPVYLSTSNTGGFLIVPGNAFTAVPENTFVGGPKGADNHWSYDAATGRWLPVDHRMISSDGNWWVYATPLEPSVSASLHLVDRHGADRTVWTGAGRAYLLGWTAGGAAFIHVGPSPQYQNEYLTVDAATGTLRTLPPIVGEPVGADASGVWSVRNLPTGPESDNSPLLHSTVIRADTRLNSGGTVTWWDKTIAALVVVLGFDGDGHPILGINGIPERYVLLRSPNIETEITGDARAAEFFPVSALGDSHGIWFGDLYGAVWLWTAGQGLTRVAQVSTHSTGGVVIAGPCR